MRLSCRSKCRQAGARTRVATRRGTSQSGTSSVRAAWASCANRAVGPIHGDIGAANVTLTEDGPVLIDWDEARVDFPFLDEIATRPANQAETRAHAAFEIAVGWTREPDRALAAGLAREIHPAPLANSGAGPI